MVGQIIIQILDENESIIDTIQVKNTKINDFESLKNIVNKKLNLQNNKVEYYKINDYGDSILINSEDYYQSYQDISLFKIKIIDSNTEIDELSLSAFGINPNIKTEITNNLHDSLKCWICLKDTIINKPFFCPNPNCLKGVHEECLQKASNIVKKFRCICGNFYNIKDFKPNKLINGLSEFTIKTNKEYKNKIQNLENKIKEYESIPKKCKKHPNDFLIHYCYDCCKAFCGTCYIKDEFNKHINHRLINYEVYKELSKYILKN